mgnify:CR=1 FL=1|jgi:putative sporulation protein YyaC
MPHRDAAAAKRVDAAGLVRFFEEAAAKRPDADWRIVCIGTDRSTGDSLGPWVGTFLRELGVRGVIGTLEHPCDAERLPRVAESLAREGAPVIAVDACLGRQEAVGAYLAAEGPLTPARSVGRAFAPIGDLSVAAVVNAAGPKPYWTLQSTSLYRVIGMARAIADAIAASGIVRAGRAAGSGADPVRAALGRLGANGSEGDSAARTRTGL